MTKKQVAEIHGLREMLFEIHTGGLPHYPLIAVFFTGDRQPADCVAMIRKPAPAAGFFFGNDLAERMHEALIVNESAHDGAIAFGRTSRADRYRCYGWSYRIVAQTQPEFAEANRGSAYNSAIALSCARGIDCVSLFLRSSVELFINGRSA